MLRIVFLMTLLVSIATPAFACHGPESEVAQERDASVLFEGRATGYELNKSGAVEAVTSGALAKVSFEVVKTIRGPIQKQRSAIMRGSNLPKSLSEFTKRFGTLMTVGLRDFSGKVDRRKFPMSYGNLLFIVDSACSMNGEDWYLRRVQRK